MIKQLLYGHNSPETAYLVNDYPYGFRLRTQIRYWIETTKNGDRFVSQTLNPKTGRWNKEKKSTYVEVKVMGLDEIGHVKTTSFSHWEDEEKLNKWLTIVDETKLNDMQQQQIKKLRAIFRTRKHVTVEMVNVTNYTEEQMAEHEAKQKEVSNTIRKVFAYEYTKL